MTEIMDNTHLFMHHKTTTGLLKRDRETDRHTERDGEVYHNNISRSFCHFV